jgi:hypothetical protein
LIWSEKGKGYSTINTPGTKGFVGFSDHQSMKLGGVTLNIDTDFAVVLVTSLDKKKGIKTARKILVTTIARAQNTGMKFNEDRTHLLNCGNAPILLEPVNLTINIHRKAKPKVTVLDHSGSKTDQQIFPSDKTLRLNGSEYKTIYYLLEY